MRLGMKTMLEMLRLKSLVNFLLIYFVHINNCVDQYSDDMAKFFDMLGSGSPDDVPEGSDDDESVEEENSRQINISK